MLASFTLADLSPGRLLHGRVILSRNKRWECGHRIKKILLIHHIQGKKNSFFTGLHVGSVRALTCCTLACSRSPSLSTSSVKVGRSWGLPCQQSNMVWYLRSREQLHWTQSGWYQLSSHRKDTVVIWIISDFPLSNIFNMQSSFLAWVRLVCLSYHLGCFVLILILSVLIASLCSSWADLRESTGVFGSLTSCQHLCPCWKNPQTFHFSCLSPFAKEFSKKSRGYLYTAMYDSVSLMGTGQWWIHILLLSPQLHLLISSYCR